MKNTPNNTQAKRTYLAAGASICALGIVFIAKSQVLVGVALAVTGAILILASRRNK